MNKNRFKNPVSQNENSSVLEEENVLTNFRSEINQHVKSFVNKSAAFASFKNFTGINPRTLKRFLGYKTIPQSNTLLSFYKWYLKIESTEALAEKLKPEVIEYFMRHGFDLKVKRDDITDIITQSKLHFKIYLLTEDNQIIKKNDLKRFLGSDSIEALNDLLTENIVRAIDDSTYTTGKIRSIHSVEYFKRSSKLLVESIPWKKLKLDTELREVKLFNGNIVISDDQKEALNKLNQSYIKRTQEIQKKSLTAPKSERQNYAYLLMTLDLMNKGEVQ